MYEMKGCCVMMCERRCYYMICYDLICSIPMGHILPAREERLKTSRGIYMREGVYMYERGYICVRGGVII